MGHKNQGLRVAARQCLGHKGLQGRCRVVGILCLVEERAECWLHLDRTQVEQGCGLRAAAPWTAVYPRQADSLALEPITNSLGLVAAPRIKVALAGAIGQAQVRRVADAGRLGMAHQ